MIKLAEYPTIPEKARQGYAKTLIRIKRPIGAGPDMAFYKAYEAMLPLYKAVMKLDVNKAVYLDRKHEQFIRYAIRLLDMSDKLTCRLSDNKRRIAVCRVMDLK